MSPKLQNALAVSLAIVLAVWAWVSPIGSFSVWVAVCVFTLAAFAFGRKLGFPFRLFFTLVVFYFGVDFCFTGRTMEPGLSGYTLGMALMCFAIFCGAPALSFLRIWKRKIGVALTLAILPVCLTLACSLAGLEEWLFVQKYRETGTGPQPRWVQHHWMAYNAEKQLLYGSD